MGTKGSEEHPASIFGTL